LRYASGSVKCNRQHAGHVRNLVTDVVYRRIQKRVSKTMFFKHSITDQNNAEYKTNKNNLT
jgi:cysteinyl-tRNA synthetase